MGLTIHYDLRMPNVTSAKEARGFVAKLRTFAKTLSLGGITEIISMKCRSNDPVRFLHQMPIYDSDDTPAADICFATPSDMILFVAQQPGSEPAVFGLAKYAKTAHSMMNEKKRPSNLPGWNWHHSCKTQYASMSNEGGFSNFFAIHDGICRILDHAASLGAEVRVSDESKYWEHRDRKKLHAEIDRWNSMVAAVVGAFKDRADRDGNIPIAAPITADPEFEHLEAKGQPFLDMVPEIHMIRLPGEKKRTSRRKK